MPWANAGPQRQPILPRSNQQKNSETFLHPSSSEFKVIAPDHSRRDAAGWQRQRRFSAIQQPCQAPCLAIACAAYSEQVGVKRQTDGVQREM